MEFIDLPTERTTAATDVLLAAVALGCATALLPLRPANPFKVHVWVSAFALLALAALLGAVVHGFKLDEGTRKLLWQPLHLSLGLTVALFVVAAVGDRWGQVAAGRSLPILLAVGVGFFGATRLFAGGFGVFIAYEAVAMLFALGVYVWLAAAGPMPGAGWMVAGVLLSIVAAAVQASNAVKVTAVWEFDHNGVFHLVQVVALVALFLGVRAALADERRGLSPLPAPPGQARRLEA
jgi:hypothetical protein